MRELEDLLIEAVYCDIIQGKLDQRNQQVEVDCSVGRDLGPNELPNIINTLQEWSVCPLCVCAHTSDICLNYRFLRLTIYLPACRSFLSLRCSGCEAVLCGIEEQVSRANQYRESQLKVKVQVETEVSTSSYSFLSFVPHEDLSFPTSHFLFFQPLVVFEIYSDCILLFSHLCLRMIPYSSMFIPLTLKDRFTLFERNQYEP